MIDRLPLGELIDVASGQVDPQAAPFRDLPHVGGDNIESDTGRLFGMRTAGELNLISGKYEFGPKDVLYSKIRPALNKVALPDFAGICSADIYPLRPRAHLIERRYLAYALRQTSFLAYAEAHSSRTNIPKINRDALLAYGLDVPPLAEQRRIADILDKADTIRRKRKEAIALTEELLRSTFLEMFGDPVTNPKGWPVRAFDEAVHDATAGNFKIQQNAYLKAGTIPIIDQGSEFTGGWTNDPALVASVELPAVLFGDHTKVVKWVSRPFVLGADGVKVLVPKRGLTPQYLYMACSQFRFPNAGYSRHFKFLKLWRFPVPPMGPQRKFGDIFMRLREHLAALERAAVCSDQLFDSLVARAFAGELESPR